MIHLTLNYIQAIHCLCHNYTSVSCLIKCGKGMSQQESPHMLLWKMLRCDHWPHIWTNMQQTIRLQQVQGRLRVSVMFKVFDRGTCRSVNLSLLKKGKEPKCSSVKHSLWLPLQITPRSIAPALPSVSCFLKQIIWSCVSFWSIWNILQCSMGHGAYG